MAEAIEYLSIKDELPNSNLSTAKKKKKSTMLYRRRKKTWIFKRLESFVFSQTFVEAYHTLLPGICFSTNQEWGNYHLLVKYFKQRKCHSYKTVLKILI
jgi:hypothetical protein